MFIKYNHYYSEDCKDDEPLIVEPNGLCPYCYEPTIDGEAIRRCYFSKIYCEVCGHSPCMARYSKALALMQPAEDLKAAQVAAADAEKAKQEGDKLWQVDSILRERERKYNV